MKNLIIGLIGIVLTITSMLGIIHDANYYGLTAEVVNVNYKDDVVTVMDANGFLWEFDGCNDYDTGDLVTMVMDDKGTEFIEDDVIVSVRYSGYFTSNNPEGRG